MTNSEWKRSFPPTLLTESIEIQKQFFFDKMISHPNFDSALEQVMFSIRNYIPGLIIFVVGPTGVGKTALAKKVAERIWLEWISKSDRKRNEIPIAGASLYVPSNHRFTWKKPNEHLLEDLKEPMISEKVKYEFPDLQTGELKMQIKKTPSIDDLTDMVIKALIKRNVMAFYFDEVNHATKIGSEDKYLDIMDHFKYIADKTQKPLILYSNYQGLDLLERSVQLDRRTVVIHFPRYDAKKEVDVDHFRKVVHDFQSYMPTQEIPDLVQIWHELYTGSLGCVGTLRDWLCLSLSKALEDPKASHITWEHLLQFRADPSRLNSRATIIMKGEEEFGKVLEIDTVKKRLGVDIALTQLYERLNVQKFKSDETEIGSNGASEESKNSSNMETSSSNRHKPKPFETAPKRRPTGNSNN